MSQTDVGEALDVTFQQVQKYERGDNRASASTLVRVGRALSVSVASLLGEADPSAMDSPALPSLATRAGHELLDAYATISDVWVRRALVRLARTLADRLRRAA
jgi:transcriptional regulator with XRE-family HTH domain